MFSSKSTSKFPTLRKTSMTKHKVYYNLILLLITLGLSASASFALSIKNPSFLPEDIALIASVGVSLHVLVMLVFFGFEGRSHRRKQRKLYLSVAQYLMELENVDSDDIKEYLRANSDQHDMQYVLTKEFYVQKSISQFVEDTDSQIKHKALSEVDDMDGLTSEQLPSVRT